MKGKINSAGWAAVVMKIAGLLATGGILGYALLVLVYCIPTGPILDNLDDAAEVLEREGEQVVKGFPTTFLTNFTDAIMLSEAGYEGEEPAYRAAVQNRFPAVEGSWRPVETLRDYQQGNRELGYFEYGRYWHGYLLLLKPLLYFFHYGQIRMLGMFAQAALFAALVSKLIQRGKGRFVVPFAAAVLCMTPLVLALSFANAVCFYIILISGIVQLSLHDRLKKGHGYILFFTGVGMAACYFDFLTWPVATLGIPLVLYLILEEDEGEGRKLGRMLLFAVCWAVGYAGIWAVKWLIGSVILQQNVFADALHTILARSGSGEGGTGIAGRMEAVLINLKVFCNAPYILFFLLNLGCQLYYLLKYRTHIGRLLSGSFCYLAAALLPVVWYAAAAEHSSIHYTFTYRALSVSVFAGLAMLANGCEMRRKR